MTSVTFIADDVTVRAVHVTRRVDTAAAVAHQAINPPTMMPLATTNTLKLANFASLNPNPRAHCDSVVVLR